MAEVALPLPRRARARLTNLAGLRKRPSEEETVGGVVLVSVAVAAMALGALAISMGARMDRDIAALGGKLVPTAAADIWLVGFMGAALVFGTALARQVADPRVWVAADSAMFAAGTAILAEVAGIIFVEAGWPLAAGVAAVIAVSAALSSGIVAVVGVSIGLVRLLSFARDKRKTAKRQDEYPQAPAGPVVNSAADRGSPDHTGTCNQSVADGSTGAEVLRARWLRAYDYGPCLGADKSRDPGIPHKEPIGVGMSGGGIRAASVMLGALQDMTFRECVLLKARYLVSVSGGGYIAGAFQQALTNAEPTQPIEGRILRDPRMAFATGSAEEDHIRRNASYISRNPGETLAALALLARHLVMNLVVLFGPAIVLGVVAALFYQAVPITDLKPILSPAELTRPHFPAISVAAWTALSILAALAGLLWLAEQLSAAHTENPGVAGEITKRSKLWSALRKWSSRMVAMVGAVFWTAAVVAVMVPVIIWLSEWVMRLSGFEGAAPVTIGTLLLTYLSSLAALLWRKRANLKAVADSMKAPAAVPRGFGQLLLVMLALAVLAAGWLLLFGGVAIVTLEGDRTTNMVVAAAVLVAVSIIGGLVDETSLSLHPFYRRRLARAFAVRAVLRDEKVRPVPYDHTERTTLSTYAKFDESVSVEFPELIFAASATLGGTETPPGSNRVSYTFSSRFVGGPEIGYVSTEELERVSSPRLRRDLTVQGAVALSGAALAVSVGAQNTKWYETLFAVTGVRLGAWMPNPSFVHRLASRKWYQPGLPRVRRMSYLLRELFGLHPAGAPLLHVTDGGFYDNLGLIELLRRRCTTVYCIDASGDNPPPASTLAEVVALAYQELGVVIDLADTPFVTTPGTGKPRDPRDALTALNPRLSTSGVMTATFTYPKESGLPENERTGTLVVAKASLWPELPYPLLAYALRNPVFPNDSTADQWFDDGQYGAYTALGRELGAAAVAAMDARNSEPAASTDKARTNGEAEVALAG